MQATNTTKTRPDGAAYLLYLGLILGLVFIIGLGYLGFRQFATVVMPQMGTFNLLALAIIAGVASFFSPCAFPLLPSYLSFYAMTGHSNKQVKGSGRVLGLGLAATAGVITFTLILGAVIGLLGASVGKELSISGPTPSQFVLWVRGSVGIILVTLGVAQWMNVNLKPSLADKMAWQTRPDRQSQIGFAVR